MSTISQVHAREVLDSRANPTVEVEIVLSDGARGQTSVPSGASTGANEAVELRDGEPDRYQGRGVLKAVENVRGQIAPELIGRDASYQEGIDRMLIDLDGTPNKSRLGANAMLGVSVAVARAAAQSDGKPLYAYLAKGGPMSLPVPMINIVNGGRHAENSTDIQEFMVVPAGFDTFRRALQAGVEVYYALRDLLRSRELSTTVGDEGGFAPTLSSNSEAVELVLAAIEKAGYVPGEECLIALDSAASEFLTDNGEYDLRREDVVMSSGQLIDMYERWTKQYPIISIEDGMAEAEWEAWRTMTGRIGLTTQIVGDDLYTTNPTRIKEGIELGASNAVLIKLNQVGTLTETLEAVRITKEASWGTVISHRSGETEDSTIADLAVATSAGQIKTGAPARGERTAKYNQLLRIEEALGADASFAGRQVYEQYLKHR
jgi:enolase